MKKNTCALCALALFFSLCGSIIQAQTTKVRGKITDAATGEPIPFVNVVYKTTNMGTISDDNGVYFIETKNASDTLIFLLMGYNTQKVKIRKFIFQEVNILLEPSNTQLDEVTVRPGENPANVLVKKINERKRFNNQDKMQSIECDKYNKMEFDICNIDSTFKQKRAFRPFQVIFDYIDTSAVNGKPYLPVFLSESVSKFYSKKNPSLEREVIEGSKITGIKNESVTQFTGDMYLKTNIYDNYIVLFKKQFISPVANVALLYYKFMVIDTAIIQGRTTYQVTFKPKTKSEPTFTGNFWVQDSTFAIVKYEMRINEYANINYVNDLVQMNEFELVDDSVWVLKKEELFVDFRLTEESFGIFGKKTTTYRNYVVNKPRPDEFYTGMGLDNTIVQENALDRNEQFWDTIRHEELTAKEQSTYQMMDTLRKVPIFRTYIELVKMFFTGYKETKYFEFGPYYTFFSFNEIEGARIRIGGRTSNYFSTKVMLDGYTAFGTSDLTFKFGSGITYMLDKQPREKIRLAWKHDLEQLGQSDNAFLQDNIINSILRRNPNNKLTWVDEFRVSYEREWFMGFGHTPYLFQRTIRPSKFVTFNVMNGTDTLVVDNIKSLEMGVKTHFAWGEKFLTGEFDRISLGTNYPIFNLDLGYGIPLQGLGDHRYFKIHLGIDHTMPLGLIGRFNYIIDMGKIFGSLPYPLLELHKGNETYGYDDYAFNLMNYYEFVSDQYTSLALIHHFDGFFFNKIPLLRRLKLREVVSAKGVVGTLSNDNKASSAFPSTLSELKTPYVEAGAGIENILKLIRIDALWRLTYLDRPNISKFGVRLKLVFDF